MEYRTSFRSFLGSLVYDLSPAAIAALVMYFVGGSAPYLLWVASGLMLLFSLLLVLQSLVVFRNRLYLDEVGIAVAGLLSRRAMRWSEVTGATLRERKNAVSRTDRLLVLESRDRMLSYVTSTLSPPEEEAVLAEVGRRTRVVVYQDKPTI